MFTKNTLKSTLGLIVTSLILSACGGGEGGGDNTPPARNTGSISGNVFDAPVSGAKIEVFEYKDGNLGRKLASTTSDAFGDYKVEFESSSMPLFIVAKEGSYTDPLTKNTVSVSNGKTLRLEAMLNYKEGRDQNLMLTPLTNIVSGLTQYKVGRGVSDSTAISESLNSINDMYGFDVNETTPIDITKGGQSSFATSGHQYGALLTAYSSYSYDLIQKYGDTQSNIYTSMHLADIQYRDVIADGLLDGLEISTVSGGVTPLTFGQQKVSSDIYTNDLAQHVLIVVNDPNLNISGTDADDYVEFSRKINDQGTNSGTGGVIPPRDETEIDTEAPTVSRTDSDVLAGLDKVDIKLNDEIGVQGVSAYLEYQLDGVWSLESQCDDEQTSDSEFCFLEFDGFESGLRETSIKVSVDTKAIDAVEVDSDTELSNVTAARLVFYTTDVLGNELVQGRDVGQYINFEWDNNAPVIDVTSASSINNSAKEYVLKGTVKEESQEIDSVTVSFKGGLDDSVTCSGTYCEFSKKYSTSEFVSITTFEIKATDSNGNIGKKVHEVVRDDQAPAQVISYPESAPMNYVNVSVDGERVTKEDVYTQDTYTSETVQSTRDYLKIDYIYASKGILSSIPDVDFSHFNVNHLKDNKIPYVRVRVSDGNGDMGLGSSADKLKLVVKYLVSVNNDNNYVLQKVTDTVASTANIPHETISDTEGHVNEVIYYVPFVKEILGDNFDSTSENSSQKLVIQTIDESENESAEQEVYFRSSFDLPTMTIVTPFIGASVQLEGLNSKGEFTSLGRCTTIQHLESDGTNKALDVAGCETTTDVVNYDFMRVRLIGIDGNTQPYYYKWESDPGTQSEQVNLNSANIGAYFKLNGSKTFYITELATYQTGLFDSQWNQVDAGNKTPENAARILDDVQNALAGGSDSFFGFDPTIVSYATNEMLKGAIPEKLPNNYIHRFLVEAIYDITQINNMLLSNSVDFASAIYDDLQYDGQANGIGSGGKKIVLDSYEFSSKSYRNDLAQSYYNIMTEKYGVAANLAQRYADQISMANPSLDGELIIDGDRESIDISPPQPSLSIENGRETWVGNKHYVAGVLNSQILLEDPSGIVVEEGSQPSFVTMWYEKTEPNTGTPIDLNIRESGGDSYKKEYLFTLDTESSNLKGIDKFELITSAMDEHGNSYGYNGEDPHIETLYIDNDYPLVTYTPPIGGDDNPVEEGVYLNTNYNQELTFTIEDPVGDKLDKRGLTFYNAATGESNSYAPNRFSSNEEKYFKVKLCSGEKCSAEDNILSPKDGNWTVYVSAEDSLSNIVNRQTTNAPQFSVLLDSKGPVVNGSKIANHLGGNSSWVPDITWSLSPGSLVKVEMKPESGRRFTLQQYETEPEESTEPYLFGIQPNVEVRLVADAFKYNEKNFFYVTATDSSFPLGTHSGEFEFLVDNKGPVIELADPWVIDTNSGESYVLGTNFTVKITSVSDDSDVSKVELWQQGQATAIRSIDPKDPTQPFDFVITETQSDAIVIGEDKKANLYLKAVDEYGFESETEIRTILLDREGPSLKLNGFDPESFYLGNYVFNLSAQDLNDRGTPSSEGVNKETLEYWTFKENPSDASTLVGDEMKIPLGGENYVDSATRTIRLGGSDIRGNTTSVDYVVKVQNSKPTIKSVTFTYEGGTPVSSAGGQIQITRSEPVIISIAAEDESGIPLVEGTYKYGEQTNSISFSQKDGLWEARLTEADLTEDGAYQLKFKVYNNVRYNSDQERPSETKSASINVQRQGVALSIAKPTDFQSHISGSTLNVEFDPVGEVKARTLECWVRENYTSEGVPEDSSNNPYSGVITNPQENYKCSVTTDVNMSVSPVVLITKTVGMNGTETVNKFSFNMMDIDAPTVEKDTYQFTGNDVGLNAEGKKVLSLTLSFKDNLSGVDISDGNEPLLVRNQLNVSFEPKSCSSKLGITTCTYTALYADILYPGALQHLYTIKNLSDIAGNLGSDHALELLLPAQGDLEIAITSPAENTFIRGETLEMKFKVKVGENSDLENVVATIDGASYNLNDNPENFSPSFIKCEDDYSCSTFTAPLGDKLDGKKIKPRIQIIDVWGESKSDEVLVTVDNSVPNIDDTVTLNESPDDANLVRFQFSVWDEGSGIASVKYTLSNPKHVFDKDNIPDNSHLYFDLPKTELQGLNSIRVNVEATDNVGWTQNKTIDIDIRVPTIDLAFDGITSLQGDKLAFTNESQAFTITSDEGEDVKAASYSIDLVPASGSTIKFSGKIASSTASDTMTFDIDAQAEYRQKVTVTDSIGRVITDVNVLNKTYDSKGIASIVDYQAPVISSITSSQDSMIPEKGQYYLDVRAYVFDKNLSSVNSTADNGTDAPVNPQSIEEPTKDGDPYLIRYLLSPGDYLITVTADDLVEHKTEKSLNAKVEAASIPELTISTTASMPLAGGVEIPLLFTFTEEVNQFEFSDVEIQASDGNDTGDLKKASWITTDNITWTVNYIAPEKQDKNITIRVGDNSYESVNTIPGTGDSLVMGVEGVLPTLTKVTFDPIHQSIGNVVNVKLEFEKDIAEGTILATLAGESLTPLTMLGDAKTWQGAVTQLPDPGLNEQKAILIVSGYTDLVGNVGSQDETHFLPITPAIQVTEPGDVTDINISAMHFSGTTKRFENSAALTLTITPLGSDTPVAGVTTETVTVTDGQWQSGTLDLSGLSNAEYRVLVTGENTTGVTVSGSETFTLNQSLAELDKEATKVKPEQADVGGVVTVTAVFTKAVFMPEEATLGSNTVVWTPSDAAQQTWVGQVAALEASDTEQVLNLTIDKFSDELGNPGVVQTKTSAVKVTPVIEVTEPGDVTDINISAMHFSGTTKRFENSAALTLTITPLGSDTPVAGVPTETVTVTDGQWQSGTLDLSGLSNAEYRVLVTGENTTGVTVSGSETFTLNQSLAELDKEATKVKPEQADVGGVVTVTAVFTKAVFMPEEATLGSNTVVWTPSDAAQQTWVGQVAALEASDTEQVLNLTIDKFSDELGNPGVVQTKTSAVKVTPVIEVTEPGDVTDINISAMHFSGTTKRFENSAALTLTITPLGSDTPVAGVPTETVTVTDGQWQSGTLDLSGLSNAEYRVLVTGENTTGVTVSGSETFTLNQSLAELDKEATKVKPEQADVGGVVTVTAVFTKAVFMPEEATLGSNTVVWTPSDAAQQTWVGQVAALEASDTEQVLNLTIDKFSDELGNPGVVQTKTSAVKVTPVIEVTEPGDVTDINISAMHFSGTTKRFENSAALTLTITPLGSDTPVAGVPTETVTVTDGQWQSGTLDLSGLSNAEYRVLVTGENTTGVTVSGSETFTLNQSLAELDKEATKVKPEQADVGGVVTVTAVFTKAVFMPEEATLGSNTVVWTPSDAAQQTWVGQVAALEASDTEQVLNLTIDKFSDELGNPGVVQTKTSAVKVTPVIEVTEPGDVTDINISAMHFSGTTKRFENSAALTLTITPLGSDTPVAGVPTETVTVTVTDGQWQSGTLDLSGLSNAEYRVLVTGENTTGVTVSGSETFTLNQSLAELDKEATKVKPEQADVGGVVTVTAVFTKAVFMPEEATLGSNTVVWTPSDAAQQTWVGQVAALEASDTEQVLNLTIDKFSDELGNPGVVQTKTSAVKVTPVIEVTEPGDVTDINISAMHFSGTTKRFENSAALTLTITPLGSDTPVAGVPTETVTVTDGQWQSGTLDLSGLSNAEYRVLVTGENTTGVTVSGSETFTLNQSLAELDKEATKVKPEQADVGGVVTVTAVFTKAVFMPEEATLGSNTVVWTPSDAAQQTWVGQVAALEASDTEQVLNLTIDKFSDELGNPGVVQTKTSAVKVTPVIEVTEPGDVTDINISAMHFSGTTKRFENSAALTLTITPLGSDTPVAGVPTETVTVTDGQWQSGTLDLSGLSNAEYRVLVTGENTTGVTVSGSETFTLNQSLAELDKEATKVKPEQADVGGVVTVTAVFTKAVFMPEEATLGSNTVVWTPSDAAQQTWVGQVAALEASDTEQVLNLTIDKFSDELGNPGVVQTKTSAVKVTPVIEVTEPGDVTDINISAMHFSGTTKRFENSAALTLTITPLGSDTPVAGVPTETVTVTDGQWQSGTLDLSGLSNAEYRVLVTGENTTGVTVSGSETFTLNQSLAELDKEATKVKPEQADVGGVVTVTAVFTKAVFMPEEATLGSNTVVWTPSDAAQQTWVGQVAALEASDTEQVLNLTIDKFSDELGNPGVVQTKTSAVKVTPVIEVTEPGDVTDINISAMHFSGTTKRFENSAALTLTITPLGSDTPVAGVPTETVTVTDGQWQSGTLDLSGLSNAEYRVLVTGENTTGVTVSGSETFTLNQSLAELDKEATKVKPEQADVGGVVTVTAVFTKAVFMPEEATLGSNTVVWTPSDAAQQTWVGQVAALEASDTEQVLNLTIDKFSDELGNPGVVQTKTSAVKVTPVIEVTEPGDVTDINISAMHFSGTTKRFENSAALTLTITPLGSDTPVAGVPTETVTVTDGQWQSGTLDLSGLSNAEYRVLVTGENTTGVTVSGSETFTLNQSLAELDKEATKVKPEQADVGGVVTVTAVFTKAVFMPEEATLGSNTVVWTPSDAAQQTWVGQVAALEASDTEQVLNLTIDKFSDELGNPGVVQTKTSAVKVTPVIEVTEPGDVTDINISAMHFSGTTKRFENSAALTLTITPLGSDTPVAGVPTETVTVTDGQWQSGTLDLSGLSNAEYRVLVTGENTTGVTVSGSETFTLNQSLAELDKEATKVKPEQADVGGVVTVTAVFTKAVFMPEEATLGSNTVVWTPSDAAQQTWVGQVAALEASDTEQVLNLTIDKFSDELGNPGVVQTKTSAVKVTPVIEVTEPGDVTDINISAMHFSGTTKRFENSAALTLTITPLGSDTPVAGVPTETVTVTVTDGQWQSGTLDLIGLSNAEYRVLVTGENTTGVTVSGSEIFNVSQALPILISATFNPPHQSEGGDVIVTLTFDKEIRVANASLGGREISLLNATEDAHVWKGEVTVPIVSELSASLIVDNYKDHSGNVGDENSSNALPITPTIFISEINGGSVVNESESPTLILDGTTVRFSEGDKLSLSITDSGGVKVSDAEVLVGENGVWQYELTLDPIEGGSVTVSLHGANALGADATLVESTFTSNKDVNAAVVVVPSLLQQLLIYDKGTKLAA